MQRYEYKVVPAPKKGEKAKGVRSTEGRFANALQLLMNEHGATGWEYQRTDTLPCEERVGLTGRTTTYQNLLVFRRALPEQVSALAPKLLAQHPSTEDEPESVTESRSPTIEMIGDKARSQSNAPAVGGVLKEDPGKTVSAPDVAAR